MNTGQSECDKVLNSAWGKKMNDSSENNKKFIRYSAYYILEHLELFLNIWSLIYIFCLNILFPGNVVQLLTTIFQVINFLENEHHLLKCHQVTFLVFQQSSNKQWTFWTQSTESM